MTEATLKNTIGVLGVVHAAGALPQIEFGAVATKLGLAHVAVGVNHATHIGFIRLIRIAGIVAHWSGNFERIYPRLLRS